MPRTHVILDALQDPRLAQELSARWARAGYGNSVDPAGQTASLWTVGDGEETPLDEAQIDAAAAVVRAFGIELRDRAGSGYRPDNDLVALRRQVGYEYKSRFATALMFGLPAVALHYAAPLLAGGGDDARSMAFPWLIELLLAAWVCIAAGWPIFWQGALSLAHLRATTDLLTTAAALTALLPSAVSVLAMAVVDEPWLRPRSPREPLFHAAVYIVTLAVLQRWLAHREAARMAGRAQLMLPRFGRLIAVWLAASAAALALAGWREAVALAMLLPPLLSLGAINPWSPGWAMALPVVAFAGFCALAPRAMGLRIEGVEVEVATGFVALMTVVFWLGWRRLEVRER